MIFECALCSATYGDPKNKKLGEKWVYCYGCGKKYHISCGETNGIVEDDAFTCIDCAEQTVYANNCVCC